jgi:transcriptional regulator with PAS, ATPase and Fis domain
MQDRPKKTLSDLMTSYEKVVIAQSLKLNRNSRKLTADALGVSTVFLWRRMKKLNMSFDEFPISK